MDEDQEQHLCPTTHLYNVCRISKIQGTFETCRAEDVHTLQPNNSIPRSIH